MQKEKKNKQNCSSRIVNSCVSEKNKSKKSPSLETVTTMSPLLNEQEAEAVKRMIEKL